MKAFDTPSWKIKKRLPAYIILALYAAIVAVPIFFAVMNSFKSSADIQLNFFTINKEMFTFDAYSSAISLLSFWKGLGNNVIILFLSLAITVLFSSLGAFAIVVSKKPFFKTVYTILLTLICIPVHAYVFQLTTVLQLFNLDNTYLGTSLVFTAISIPVAIFMYTGFMKSVPIELYEAAVIDGASTWKIYSKIYMPLMITVTGTILILRGTFIWNNLLVSMVTITDASKIMLIPRTYAFNSSTYTRWDLVLASSVLVSIPVMILYVFMQKSFVRGISAGAVKG